MSQALVSPEYARTIPDPSKFGELPFWNNGRLETLRELLGPLGPNRASNSTDVKLKYEWQRVVDTSNTYTPKGPLTPFYIPHSGDDPAGTAAATEVIDSDSNVAMDLALRWMLFKEDADALAVVRILKAWSASSSWTIDSRAATALVWSNRMAKMIQASLMIKSFSGYTQSDQQSFKSMISRSIAAGASASLVWTNNVGAWGVVFDFASSVLLDDRTSFKSAIAKWVELFDYGVKKDIPELEVTREAGSNGPGSNGLWYSNFLLCALIFGAEWARYSGEWLYDYVAPDGSSLKGLAKKIQDWSVHPTSFPYYPSTSVSSSIRALPHHQIIHALWPSEDSNRLYTSNVIGNDNDSVGLRSAALLYRGRPLWG